MASRYTKALPRAQPIDDITKLQKFMLTLAAIFSFQIWLSDVKLAFLQSAESMLRRELIRDPSKVFEFDSNQFLELIRSQYGLADFGDLWNTTLRRHLMEDLGIQHPVTDQSLSVKYQTGTLEGINTSNLDELLPASTEKLISQCKKTR